MGKEKRKEKGALASRNWMTRTWGLTSVMTTLRRR